MPYSETESIKERILTLLGGDGESVPSEVFASLLADKLVAVIRREVDPLADCGMLPALMVFDGDEMQVDEETDTRGRRFRFPVVLRWVTNANGPEYIKERRAIVPRIQELMETHSGLAALLTVLPSGGEEKPFASIQATTRGADIWYFLDYRRLRGDPWTTY